MSTRVGQNILVVDDSATTRTFIRRAIALAGLRVGDIFEAADGQAALEIIGRESIDIVLADLHMPGMDGEEMSRRIFADPALRNISVIVVTADPNETRIQSLLQAGAKGYLAKPFTPEAFRSAMSGFLGGQAA